MRRLELHAPSLVLGILSTALVGTTLASTPAPTQDDEKWEHQILLDVQEDDLEDLAKDGWEFAGYLGVSKRGANTDETLWRRVDD